MEKPFHGKLQKIFLISISFMIVPISHYCGMNSSPMPEDLERTLSIDRTEYEVGESIKMTLTVENVADESVELTFNDGQIYDFAVTGLPEGIEVWRWSIDKAFTQAVWYLTLAPGEEASYSEIWDQKDNAFAQVKPGLYRIEGDLSSEPELFAAPVEARIRGEQPVECPFETIDKGFFSGYIDRASLVIKDEEEWTRVWDMHTKIISPAPPLPEVDFSKRMIIAVFRGQFTSSGYSTEITEVTRFSDKVRVSVVETDDTGGMLLDVLTQPYHIIELEKSDLPVELAFTRLEL